LDFDMACLGFGAASGVGKAFGFPASLADGSGEFRLGARAAGKLGEEALEAVGKRASGIVASDGLVIRASRGTASTAPSATRTSAWAPHHERSWTQSRTPRTSWTRWTASGVHRGSTRAPTLAWSNPETGRVISVNSLNGRGAAG
jgi:hypothetical protein